MPTVTDEDIRRWRAQGESEERIQTWIRNSRHASRELREVQARMAERWNRMRQAAPGTNGNDAPNVIDGTARDVTCPVCGGTKVILTIGGNPKPCPTCGEAEYHERRAKSLDKYSSASGRARMQTFDNFEVRSELAACKDASVIWADEPEGWLVIWGNPGNGKSHLCAAVYNHLRAAAKPAIFITGPELLRSLKALMDDEVSEAEGETMTQRLEKYQRAPVLIIDDLRAEQRTAWSDATWFDLLDYRYRNRLPTMIATNCNPAGEDFVPRLSSRLRDEHDGFSLVFHNTAPDFRTVATTEAVGEVEL